MTGPFRFMSSRFTSGGRVVLTLGICATAALKRSMASSGSTLPASCATRSTRRTGSTEKFWIVSPKILPLPTMVITLSGVIDRGAEQAELVHRAGHAADGDEVAHLEWPQDQHEGAGREVAQQPAPGRADGHARAGQHRRETRWSGSRSSPGCRAPTRCSARWPRSSPGTWSAWGRRCCAFMPAWIRPITLPINQRPMTQKAIAAKHLDGQFRSPWC